MTNLFHHTAATIVGKKDETWFKWTAAVPTAANGQSTRQKIFTGRDHAPVLRMEPPRSNRVCPSAKNFKKNALIFLPVGQKKLLPDANFVEL